MKVYRIRKINDMALARVDAIDRCYSLGKKFIEHFHKIYKSPDDINVNHWAGEMQGWLNSVKDIRLKMDKNRSILDGELRDWFYTAGSTPESIVSMDSEEQIAYDKFVTCCINTGDVRGSLKGVGK